MSWYRPQTLLDKSYEIGIIIKGVDGLLEFVAGALLLLVPPHVIGSLAYWLAHGELTEDPHSFIATHVLHTGQSLAVGYNWFAISFLLLHGAVKVVLVACLLRNKLWAYPYALVALVLFLGYQAYELVVATSLGMALLTLLDIIIIWLIWREWHKVRNESRTG